VVGVGYWAVLVVRFPGLVQYLLNFLTYLQNTDSRHKLQLYPPSCELHNYTRVTPRLIHVQLVFTGNIVWDVKGKCTRAITLLKILLLAQKHKIIVSLPL
jgi:hypothetical protein